MAKSLQHVKAAHASWNIPDADRPARTLNARLALEDKFLAEAGGDPKRAATLRKLFYTDLAMKSVQARARRRGGDAA
jgi:hypothetical protein